MTAPGPRVPSDRPARERPDPIAFSAAEKLAAEWEARHDVAAPGRRSSGLGVAQYMAHERCTEACTPPGHRHHPPPATGRPDPSAPAAARSGAQPAPPPPDLEEKPHRRGWHLWGGFNRGRTG